MRQTPLAQVEAGLPPTRSAALIRHANPLLALHALLVDHLPQVARTAWAKPPPRGSHAAGHLALLACHGARAAGEVPHGGQALVHYPASCDLGHLRGKLVWPSLVDQTDGGNSAGFALLLDAVRHGYGFAVPTDAALDAIAARGPVLEVGAGVGYWAAVRDELRHASLVVSIYIACAHANRRGRSCCAPAAPTSWPPTSSRPARTR